MKKRKICPTLKCMTIEEVNIMNKVCTGMEVEEVAELVSCIDDLLSIQSIQILINSRIGKRKHTARTIKDVMAARIAGANFSTNNPEGK